VHVYTYLLNFWLGLVVSCNRAPHGRALSVVIGMEARPLTCGGGKEMFFDRFDACPAQLFVALLLKLFQHGHQAFRPAPPGSRSYWMCESPSVCKEGHLLS
jgi:hypothetical protein